MSDVRVVSDADALSHAVAREVVGLCRQAVAARGRFILALAGGSTPRRVYELLAGQEYGPQVEWPRVEFFWGDERAVPSEHPDSNYGMAMAAGLGKLDLRPEQVHRIHAERPDRDSAARAYEREIERIVGVSPDGVPPAFDLILLGMGADGHTASLFPYTEALREERRHVVRNYVPTLQAERITLTFPMINRARELRVVVAGADKAPVLKEVLEGPRDPERLPSQRLAPVAGRLAWLVDRTAARDLALEDRR